MQLSPNKCIIGIQKASFPFWWYYHFIDRNAWKHVVIAFYEVIISHKRSDITIIWSRWRYNDLIIWTQNFTDSLFFIYCDGNRCINIQLRFSYRLGLTTRLQCIIIIIAIIYENGIEFIPETIREAVSSSFTTIIDSHIK